MYTHTHIHARTLRDVRSSLHRLQSLAVPQGTSNAEEAIKKTKIIFCEVVIYLIEK